MKKLAAALLFAAVGFAQQSEMQTKAFELKNIGAQDAVGLMTAVNGIANFQVSRDSRFLILRGTSDGLTAAESLIRQIDVGPKNIDLTFYILSASPQPASDKTPPELEPVLKQLKSAFVYQGYKVLETTVMRVREGKGGDLSGQLAGGNSIYQIRCQRSRVSPGTPNTIRVDELSIEGRFPITDAKGEVHWTATGIKTDIDMKEGQKIVVGKSTMNDSAAFLVVSAHVLD